MEKPTSISDAADDAANIVASIRRAADAVIIASRNKEPASTSDTDGVNILALVKALTELTSVSHNIIDMQQSFHDCIKEKDETNSLSDLLASENEELRAQIEVVKQTKIALLRNMSHELRTPLTAIIGFAEMIQAEVHGPLGNAKYVDYMSDIIGAGRHLLSQVGQLLEVANVEADRLPFDRQLIQVRPPVERAVALVSGIARNHGVEVHANFSSSLPCIWFDEDRLTQVVIGVLENAIKYSKQNELVSVDVEVFHESMIQVTITDRGKGMSEEAVCRALSYMHTSDPFYAYKRRGLGLGLAYANRLIESQGGTLSVHSEVDVGTVVKISLPTSTHSLGVA